MAADSLQGHPRQHVRPEPPHVDCLRQCRCRGNGESRGEMEATKDQRGGRAATSLSAAWAASARAQSSSLCSMLLTKRAARSGSQSKNRSSAAGSVSVRWPRIQSGLPAASRTRPVNKVGSPLNSLAWVAMTRPAASLATSCSTASKARPTMASVVGRLCRSKMVTAVIRNALFPMAKASVARC